MMKKRKGREVRLKAYTKPQLERLGNVVELTANGSKSGAETGGNVFGKK